MRFKTIRQTVVLEATPMEVYEAYVDPKKHTALTGESAEGAPRVGGKFAAGDGYIWGRYVSLEKGKEIIQEWETTEWPPGYPPSKLELKLSSKGGKTVLRMTHSKVPAEQAEYYAEGWREYYWGPLKKYFKEALEHSVR